MLYINQEMGLFNWKKKQATPEPEPQPTPEQVRKQGLLDFAKDYTHRWHSGNRPPTFSIMPQWIQDMAEEDGGMVGWRNWRDVARPLNFTTTDFMHDGDWYANTIASVPAEHVGGKKGETRYYGGAYNFPLRGQTRDMAQAAAITPPYHSVEDSIPAAEAKRLKEEWMNR